MLIITFKLIQSCTFLPSSFSLQHPNSHPLSKKHVTLPCGCLHPPSSSWHPPPAQPIYPHINPAAQPSAWQPPQQKQIKQLGRNIKPVIRPKKGLCLGWADSYLQQQGLQITRDAMVWKPHGEPRSSPYQTKLTHNYSATKHCSNTQWPNAEKIAPLSKMALKFANTMWSCVAIVYPAAWCEYTPLDNLLSVRHVREYPPKPKSNEKKINDKRLNIDRSPLQTILSQVYLHTSIK